MTSSETPGNSGPVVLGGRYEVHRRLARGGMAEVFLARDQALDRPVAVKILFPEFATDPAFVERFRREAQAAANLSHPNIVGVYDWGAESGTYYIVMEYVEGQSLAEVIRDNGPLQPRRAAEIT
ncbi:MAG: serine/threonine protein kinase, partial [Actinobacteria bacterium]|nr:serine/threonine protein kinase [Actinomycetota bacterium]